MDGITIEGTDNLLKAFARLDTKEMKKVHKDALNKVTGILQTEARKNLRGITGRHNTITKTPGGSTRGPLTKGITKKVWKSGEGATVTILGDYRLKWFESGTTERITKGRMGTRYRKPKATGKMTATYFFKKSIDSKQSNVEQEINDNLSKAINRVWNKK